jgi:hypothetical protein
MSYERPTHLTSRINSLSQETMQGLGGRRPPSLSIEGNQFTPVDALGNKDLPFDSTYVDVVIVAANKSQSKMMYEGKYGDNVGAPPICFSNNGEAPSTDSSKPQARWCRDCWFNVWGSDFGRGGRKIKKCKDYKKVVLHIAYPRYDQRLVLSIPPNSFAGLAEYTAWLHNQNGTDIGEVVTRIRFAPEPSGTLVFSVAQAENGQPKWVTPKFLTWLDSGEGAKEKPKWREWLGLNERPIDDATKLLPLPEQVDWLKGQKTPEKLAQVALEAPKVIRDATLSSEPKRAVGRPRKVVEAPPAAEVPPNEFLDRRSPGMVNDAPAPDSDLGEIIDNEFGL